MKKGFTYTLTVGFIVDHKLTEDEIQELILQVSPQIEEPVTQKRDAVEYEIKLLSCEIEKDLPGERCECQ